MEIKPSGITVHDVYTVVLVDLLRHLYANKVGGNIDWCLNSHHPKTPPATLTFI